MKTIYIGSTKDYSGKSLVTLGLGLRMQEDGLKTGYMKPYGRTPVMEGGVLTDGDASFMKKTLRLTDPIDKICPVVSQQDLFASAMKGRQPDMRKKVMAAYASLKKGRDVLLVGGARGIYDGAFIGVSGAELVADMGAGVVMVDPFNGEACIDCLLNARDIFGEGLIGAVINKVPPDGVEYIRDIVGPYLKRKGIPLLGILPTDRLLGSITVRRLAESLGGRTMCCKDRLDELVENFLIGAMEVESALKYFRRTPNKAVITGGHRSDILLAALETSTRCLVLTGNLLPNEIILNKAKNAGVPVILVKQDTMSAMELIEGAHGRVRIREGVKVERASELMDAHFDFGAFYRLAGIKKP